jgi:Dolichyl-phosphate-mannose-protein mannosyltransferase
VPPRRLDLAGRAGVVVVAGFLVLLAVHHVLWLHHFRSGLPLDIDEAGYLSFSLDDLRGFTGGGLDGLYQAVTAQRQFGPLVPLTAAPILGILGAKPIGAMTVQFVFLGVLGFSMLGLGRRLVGARLAVLLVMVTLLVPAVLDFTRTFHFVIASAALLCASVWALVRSEGLERRWWVVAAGAFAGLMLLSRTMTVAFLPGLGFAAVALVVAAPERERTKRMLHLLLGGVAGFLVAAWWYLPNLAIIVRYLTGYGYGAKSAQYAGTRAPVVSVTFWVARLRDVVDSGLYLGVAAVMGLTFLVAIVSVVTRQRSTAARSEASPGTSDHRGRAAVRTLASPAGTVGIVLVVSYLALTSSRTSGTGFYVPLVPFVVLMWGTALRVVCWGWVRAALAWALVATAVLTVVSKAEVNGPLAGPRCASVPALDCVRIVDGRGVSQQQPAVQQWATLDPSRARRGLGGDWVRATNEAASFAIDYARERGVDPIVFFASRDPLFNTNSVGLAGRVSDDHAIPMGQLVPDPGGDTIQNYRRHLDDPRFGWPNVLITVERGPHEFRPAVDQAKAARAARKLGFELVHRQRLPDGRVARFYWLQRGPVAS